MQRLDHPSYCCTKGSAQETTIVFSDWNKQHFFKFVDHFNYYGTELYLKKFVIRTEDTHQKKMISNQNDSVEQSFIHIALGSSILSEELLTTQPSEHRFGDGEAPTKTGLNLVLGMLAAYLQSWKVSLSVGWIALKSGTHIHTPSRWIINTGDHLSSWSSGQNFSGSNKYRQNQKPHLTAWTVLCA